MTESSQDAFRGAMYGAAKTPVAGLSEQRSRVLRRRDGRRAWGRSGLVLATALGIAATLGVVALLGGRGGSDRRVLVQGASSPSLPTGALAADADGRGSYGGEPVLPQSTGSGVADVSPAQIGGFPGTTISGIRSATTVVVSRSTPAQTAPPVTETVTPPTVVGTKSSVRGTVMFSPVCPVEQTPPDARCSPKPGPADVTIVHGDGTLAGTGHAGADGGFQIAVEPGRYSVQASPAPIGVGKGCSASPSSVVVITGAISVVAVTCDTGIR